MGGGSEAEQRPSGGQPQRWARWSQPPLPPAPPAGDCPSVVLYPLLMVKSRGSRSLLLLRQVWESLPPTLAAPSRSPTQPPLSPKWMRLGAKWGGYQAREQVLRAPPAPPAEGTPPREDASPSAAGSLCCAGLGAEQSPRPGPCCPSRVLPKSGRCCPRDPSSPRPSACIPAASALAAGSRQLRRRHISLPRVPRAPGTVGSPRPEWDPQVDAPAWSATCCRACGPARETLGKSLELGEPQLPSPGKPQELVGPCWAWGCKCPSRPGLR